MENEVQTVPLAAYESQAQRDHMTMRYIIIGWCISVVVMAFIGLVMFSYEEQTITETTTETIERVAEADHQGNAVVGDGDISIGDSTSDGYEDQDNDNDYA